MPQHAHAPFIDDLLAALASMQPNKRSENLYRLDEEAGGIRASNLNRYLNEMFARHAHMLMVVEAPGYRGCAKTGIPITSERIMLNGVEPFTLFGEGYQPTSTNPAGMAEASATIMWGALVEHMVKPPLLWNTYPLHPHKPDDTETNRTPTRTEQRYGHPFIERLMEGFNIKQVFGVGRIAQRNLAELGIPHTPLRHPAQGGKAEFISGLRAALKG
jgi:uracil-DNA glycosylase